MHTDVQTYERVMLFIGFSILRTILLLCSGFLTMGHEHHVCVIVQLKSIPSMIPTFKLVE